MALAAYVTGSGATAAEAEARKEALGCDGWMMGAGVPHVLITAFGQADQRLDDSTGQVTADQVAAARSAARSAEDATISAAAAATAALKQLAADRGSFQASLDADVAAVASAGWDGLTAQQRTDIISRILHVGLASTMQAHLDHLIVAGIVPPQ